MSDKQANHQTNHPLVILIVEDELFNYIYFNEVLKLHDIHTIKAENGEEALEAVRQNPNIDMILMDIKMPFMDGYEAFNAIREIQPDIPIVAQTAYALSHERQEILNFGFNDYIAKPVEEEQLMEVIHNNLPESLGRQNQEGNSSESPEK